MQAQWKLSRAYGVANLMVLHRLSDLDGAGAHGSTIRTLADGLLADCSTRILYRQQTDQLPTTATALGLTGPERELLPALPRGTGCGDYRAGPTSCTTDCTPTSSRSSTPTPPCAVTNDLSRHINRFSLSLRVFGGWRGRFGRLCPRVCSWRYRSGRQHRHVGRPPACHWWTSIPSYRPVGSTLCAAWASGASRRTATPSMTDASSDSRGSNAMQ